MRANCVLAAIAAAAAGCSGALRHGMARAPLDAQGEIVVRVRPFPPQLAGVKVDVAAVSVSGKDGVAIPLELRQAAISGGGDRLLALGQLEPGAYGGLSIEVRGAEPAHVDHPFMVERGRASVVALQARPGPAGTPVVFEAIAPPKILAQLTGYVSSSGLHDLAAFDKRALEVGEVLATGRGPWGVRLDEVQLRAYVALSGEDQIEVVDVQSGAALARIRLGLGDEPRDVALTPDRRLLLSANAGSNSVSFLDPASMIELDRVRVGEEPTWIAIDRRGNRAYVSNWRSNSISVIDLGSHAVTATLSTEDRPLRVQFDRAGSRMYVAQPRSSSLTVVSLPDLSVQRRVYVGLGASALKVDPSTDLVYVGHRDQNRLAVFDPFSFIPIDSIELPDAASYLSIDDQQNRLFILMAETGSAAVVDLASRRMLGTFDVGDDPRVLSLMGERF